MRREPEEMFTHVLIVNRETDQVMEGMLTLLKALAESSGGWLF